MFNINLIRRFPLFSIIIFTLVLWTVMLAPAGAQTDQSRISGTVHDQVGAVIPGATITIRNERTGETRTATSTPGGIFLVPNLKPSLYKVTVAAANFAKTEYTGLELVVGQELNLSVELKPVGATETVTIVGGDDAALDTSSARMGANVNQQEVQSLPLNGRQLSQLYLQAPGALNSGS
ncbi:MAG TPA: carboxypeptidase-like regulatory domain-containing protein, partial [Blastocatellia bacterium]|nr:carboxypeptidase-like regulatory domain-containing protein [Blastocatellia bacterium]